MSAFTLSMLDRKLLRGLWQIKGQALAIMLVIASGISLLVMSSGMLISLDETGRAYYERYRFADVFAPVVRAPNYLLLSIRNLPGIADVEGRITGGGLVDLPGNPTPLSARIVSFDPSHLSPINGVYLSEGRLMSQTRPDEVLLLRPFAEAHGLEPGDSLAVTMNGKRYQFTIAGLALSPEFIYAIPPGEFATDSSRYAILWVGQETLEAAYDMDGAFNETVVTLARDASEDEVIERLDRLLSPYGATGAYGRTDQISNKYLTEEMTQLKTMGRVMTPIFLSVSVFLLNIVITRLVQTERGQIGLLKAFGYTNRDVGLHYLKFAFIIAIGGALIGWIAGLWLGRMLSTIYQMYFSFPFLIFVAQFRMLGVAIAISALSAALGAFLAVRMASSLTPAVAMRPPAPPKFSHGNGFSYVVERFLDQPSRMVLRRIIRSPWKAGLTTFGIAAGMGLSVMMRFNLNATDYMLETSFNVIDRSDILVTFVDPLADKTLLELARIDGVNYVEPARNVPVLFRNESKRINHLGGVTGLSPQPELNRALDSKLRPITVSGQGIVLSEQLADLLAVTTGDTLTLEVRSGRRPELNVPVTGIVEALIGTPAYMDQAILNKMLKEPGRVSGAYLKIDQQKREQIYAELKDIPKIAGVSLHREAYENFKEMIDEGPGTFRSIMAVVSIIIAAGVIYNSARIAFIERAHDLASLRVLGFTKVESGYVLLGELGFLTIIALPLGSLFGYLLWAYLANSLSTELYQIPIIFKEDGLGHAGVIILVAAIVSGAFVQRDVGKLEIASALKTRE